MQVVYRGELWGSVPVDRKVAELDGGRGELPQSQPESEFTLAGEGCEEPF